MKAMAKCFASNKETMCFCFLLQANAACMKVWFQDHGFYVGRCTGKILNADETEKSE
jgi:hypothetical protein